MHPVIKIVNLVIVSIFLTQGSGFTLLLTGALLLPFYIRQLDLWHPAVKMLFRLKWFFISILLIYYLYTPDAALTTQTTIRQISERALPGLFRIAVLVFILFSVNLFIRTTSKEEILSALLWLFSPLKLLAINTQQIALRAVLTLEYIEVLSRQLIRYKEKKNLQNHKESNFFRQKKIAFLQLIEHSGIILYDILEQAESTSGQSYTIDCLEPPDFIQFLFPLMLCLLFSFSL